MRKKIIAFILIFLFIISGFDTSFQVSAQTTTVLPSSLTLDEMISKTDEYIKENNTHNIGLAFSVVSSDEILHLRTSGYANKKQNLPVDTNTIFEWGSLTKTLTWTSVMQLWEQGKIDLNEDIKVYLPEGFLKKLTFQKKITMLDLMNHTAGWQHSMTNVFSTDFSNVLSLEDYLSKCEPTQLYEPGTTVAYSNFGVTLAGYIVERISGEDYCDYVENHILKPLQMNHTYIRPFQRKILLEDETQKEHFKYITGYTSNGKNIPGCYYVPAYPAGGAYGTIEDVCNYVQALLSEDASPLFTHRDTIRTMFSPTRSFSGTDIPENAHGFWYDYYQTPTIVHFGNTPQFSCYMALDLKNHIGMIVMMNLANEMAFSHDLGNFVFGEPQSDTSTDSFQKFEYHKYYVSARAIKHGYSRFYDFFQTYRIKETGENQLAISSPFIKMECDRISNTSYLVKNGMLKGFQIFVDINAENEVQKLSTSTFDFIPYSSSHYLLDCISFLFAIFALILSILSLILCVRFLCKKKGKGYLFSLGSNLLSLFFFFALVLEVEKLLTSGAFTKDMIPYVGYYGFYLAFGFLHIIHYLRTKHKDVTKTTSFTANIILMSFILYWQMFLIS